MLTDRDKQILELMIEGKHDKEIGRALGLSDITVRGVVRLICAKLDAPSRIAAAVKYACPERNKKDPEPL